MKLKMEITFQMKRKKFNMTESMMNIPPTIKVGYQNRSDTYTNKLAYVIYYDEKGVLRKEKSWDGWRDKKIPSNEFKNEPTSGFVLNKKVGDYKSDWNHRQAAVRVYDPRGFEFEIGVENLLYILQECTSTKGKGLEGDFVYAWDRSDLVLLPTSAQEYVSSRKFTDMKSMKVGKKDMKEGCVYTTKDMQTVIYLGQHEVFVFEHDYDLRKKVHGSVGKKHVFKYTDEERDDDDLYWFQDGFTKLATKVSDEIANTFADDYDKFKKSKYGNKCGKVVVSQHPITLKMLEEKNFWRLERIEKSYQSLKRVNIEANWDYSNSERKIKNFHIEEKTNITIDGDSVTEKYIEKVYERQYGYYNSTPRKVEVQKTYTAEEIIAMEWHRIDLVNDYNKKIQL